MDTLKQRMLGWGSCSKSLRFSYLLVGGRGDILTFVLSTGRGDVGSAGYMSLSSECVFVSCCLKTTQLLAGSLLRLIHS